MVEWLRVTPIVSSPDHHIIHEVWPAIVRILTTSVPTDLRVRILAAREDGLPESPTTRILCVLVLVPNALLIVKDLFQEAFVPSRELGHLIVLIWRLHMVAHVELNITPARRTSLFYVGVAHISFSFPIK